MKASDMQNDRPISANMGGDVADFVDDVLLKEWRCPSCGRTTTIGSQSDIRGYEHDGGLDDENGQGWWVYVSCGECPHDESFGKVESNLQDD